MFLRYPPVFGYPFLLTFHSSHGLNCVQPWFLSLYLPSLPMFLHESGHGAITKVPKLGQQQKYELKVSAGTIALTCPLASITSIPY